MKKEAFILMWSISAKMGRNSYQQQIIYPIGHIQKQQEAVLRTSSQNSINSMSRLWMPFIFLKGKVSFAAILDNKWEARLITSEPFFLVSSPLYIGVFIQFCINDRPPQFAKIFSFVLLFKCWSTARKCFEQPKWKGKR